MLDKTKKHNRIKVLRGKLQKMAVQYRAFTNSSSFVGNMRYDQDEQSMTGILSGKHYKWCGVPESKFDSFQGAGSAGAFFNRDIKGQYDCSSMGKLNQVKSRISQLQKMAIDYKTNWKTHGADMDAIRAFKSKEVYSSGENHPSGSKFKFRTDGKSLFLHDYEVARHHKDGIEISNAGYDSPLTYKTHQALGINSKGHAKHPKGLITLGTKEIDKNSGEWVLVKHSDISEEPIIPDTMRKNQKARADGTFVERKKPKRETAEQASFRKRATKKELKEQGRKGGKPLSKVNIQKTDQRIINAISGLKKSLPTDKRGQAAHHLLEYSGDGDIGKKLGLNKKDNDDENNSIMLPHDYHDFISHYNTSNPKTNLDNLRQMDSKIKQLQGKLQKIAFEFVDDDVGKNEKNFTSNLPNSLVNRMNRIIKLEKTLPPSRYTDFERARNTYENNYIDDGKPIRPSARFRKEPTRYYPTKENPEGKIMGQPRTENIVQFDPDVKKKYAKLKGKLQKIATDINRSPVDNNMSKSDEIINSFQNSGLSIEGVDGVYDTKNHKVLDGYNQEDIPRIREIYGEGVFIGTNSETDTRDGPNTNDLERTRKELQAIEDKGGIPALGFDSTEGGSLEALNVAITDSKEKVMDALYDNQWGTYIISPNNSSEIIENPKYTGRNK